MRLKQGRMDAATVFSDDPLLMASRWQEQGARCLHVVDLNGAFAGSPVNAEAVAAIVAACPQLPVQLGGGIRDMQSIEFYVDCGVRYIIIGTQAVRQPAFVREACEAFPERIMVGIDAVGGVINGRVATDGWAKMSQWTAVELAEKFSDYGVEAIIYTDISRDGMLRGVNVAATAALASRSPVPIIASGGISKLADITALKEAATKIASDSGDGGIIGVITGRAIYEGLVDLAQAQRLADEPLPQQPSPDLSAQPKEA